MKRTLLLAALALGVAALTQAPAAAQGPGMIPPSTLRAAPYRPAVSPYAALGSRSPALNYFTVTRPSLETRALLSRQEAEIKGLERKAETRGGGEGGTGQPGQFSLPRTGHKTYFSNLSHYYVPPR